MGFLGIVVLQERKSGVKVHWVVVGEERNSLDSITNGG